MTKRAGIIPNSTMREQILLDWQAQAFLEVPAASTQSKLALQDEIPAFLDDLLEAIERGEFSPDTACKACKNHALQRSFNPAYKLPDVLKEYEILHEVILDVLERDHDLSKNSQRVIRGFIHMAMQRATAAFTDIKHLHQLSKERDFLSVVLENLTDGVVACDQNGILTLFNQAARAFHGVDELPVTPEQWALRSNLYRSDGRTPLRIDEIPLYRALQGEQVQDVELIVAIPGRPALDMLCCGRALRDHSGAITGAVLTMHDVSDLKIAEEYRLSLATEHARCLEAERAELVTTQILSRISDAFFAMDSNWGISYVNNQFEKFTRRAREDLLGTCFWDAFPETVGSTFEYHFCLAVAEQRALSFETYLVSIDQWLRIRVFPSQDGLSVYGENITELRRADLELRSNEEWLRATMASIGDAVIAAKADNDKSIVFMNSAASALTGWSFAEARSHSIDEVFQLIDSYKRRVVELPLQRVLSEGVEISLAKNVSLISRDGQECLIEASAAPVLAATGTITGVVLVFRDISGEHELREQVNLLARVVELVPSFVSVAKPDGQMLFLNQFGRDLIGLASPEELSGKSMLDFFPESERVRIEQCILPKLLEHESWDGEIVFQNFRTGERVPLLWNSFGIKDEETGQLKALACVSTDLRERNRLDAERAHARDQIESERARLFNLFDQAPMPIAVLEGPEHVFVLANPAYINLLFGRRDLLGRRVREALPEIESQVFPALLDEVFQTGKAYQGLEMPGRFLQADGSMKDFYLNFIYQPMLNAAGEVQGILVFANDVTSQVEARKLVRLSEERFRNLADSMPQLVWSAKISGQLDYVNRGLLDYTGLSEREVFNWQGANYVHPDDLPQVKKLWEASIASGAPYEMEMRLKRFDGEFRWFLCRAVRVEDGLGIGLKWYGSSTDIQEQKQLAVDLDLAKTYAENATRAKSSFLANMSHEIRTPLAAILGFSQFLIDPKQTVADRQECVLTIRRNAEQLARLINELLDLSKIEADRLEIEKVVFKLEDVIQDVDQLLSFYAREKGISLRFMSKGPVQRSVLTDPMRLRQILINIVGNAIKFTEAGFVEVQIGMTMPQHEGEAVQLVFTVRDTGIGLSPDQVERIWEPFVQADNSMTRKFGGTGLGLSLSRKLARALGGDLVLSSSQAGLGSVFSFNVDAGPLEAGALYDDAAQTIIARETAAPSDLQALNGLNLLLVEDSPDNRALVTRILSNEGARVDIAVDGEEGAAKALAGNYDVILMDVQMPRLDGYEATRRIRKQGQRVPIIALTAHAMKGDRERAMAAGFDDHLTKPIDHKLMIDKIIAFHQQKLQPVAHARGDPGPKAVSTESRKDQSAYP